MNDDDAILGDEPEILDPKKLDSLADDADGDGVLPAGDEVIEEEEDEEEEEGDVDEEEESM